MFEQPTTFEVKEKLDKSIKKSFKTYLKVFPNEKEAVSTFEKQIFENQDLNSRSNMEGHATASGLVFSPDGSKVLMIFHKGLERYLQPGGHIDDIDSAPWEAAAREVTEETGLGEIQIHPWHEENDGAPINFDTHPIKASLKKDEEAHFHHDFLYMFKSKSTEITLQEEEVDDFEWVDVNDPNLEDGHVAKALQKARELNLI